MYKALDYRWDVDKLYVSRDERGRRVTIILDSVDASIQRLTDCIKKRGGKLITATRNNIDNISINRAEITRKPKSEEKQLYGDF